MPAAVAARFIVRTATLHPRLVDYDRVAHRYGPRFIRRRRVIEIDVFPGMILRTPDADVQHRPGSNPHGRQDTWELLVPADTTGWTFTVNRKRSLGGLDGIVSAFSATHSTRLGARTGVFDTERPDNPWKWQVEVPGSGTYTVSVVETTATGSRAPKTVTLAVRELLVVSVGDSSASGQGLPDVPGRPAGFDPDLSLADLIPGHILFTLSKELLDLGWNTLKREWTTASRKLGLSIDMDPEPQWLEPKAYRSLRSGVAVAARALEHANPGLGVRFLAFGRTGSSIPDGLLGPRTSNGASIDGWIGGIGQLDEVRRTFGNRRIDALIVQIGVNDIGVSSSLTSLVSGDNPLFGGGDDTAARALVEKRALARLATLPQRFAALAAAIDERLDVDQVHLVEYPTALFDGTDGEPRSGCGLFSSRFDLDLTPADARLIRSLAEQLNRVLRAAAHDHGWHFVTGIADDFRGHGYCTGTDRFFVQAEESMVTQGDTEGTIHPNQAGAAVIAKRIQQSLQRHAVDRTPVLAPVTPGNPG